MFEYTLPCGGFKTLTKMTDTAITFDPPVYEQRYCAAIQILEDLRWVHEIKKVTEFGCAEMRLFQLMRRIETIEDILQVDIDQETLNTHLNRLNPLVSDFIRQRQCPLHVKALLGSVADPSEELRNTDAVVALELIEHVYDDVLSKIPLNVFGFMQPKIVIFSTPNSDFNVMFTRFGPLLPNGFRHHDHKFEWTREEFKNWCLGITEKYPNYVFALLGVGEPPPGHESVGHVSQIALFVRKDILGMPLVESLQLMPVPEGVEPYKTLLEVDYPFHKDTTTLEQKIWVDVEFELQRCTRDEENYDSELRLFKLPIAELLKRLEYRGATREMLEQLLLQHNKQVANDFVLIQEEEEDDDHDDYYPYAEEEHDPNIVISETEEEMWDT